MQEETAFESFLAWYSCVTLIPYDLEFTVYDDDSAGTCDFLGELTYPEKKIFNRVYYLDWKTGMYSDRYSHGPQIAQYKKADGRFPGAGIAVVHFNKDAVDFKFVDYSKYERNMLNQYFLMEELFYSRHQRTERPTKLPF